MESLPGQLGAPSGQRQAGRWTPTICRECRCFAKVGRDPSSEERALEAARWRPHIFHVSFQARDRPRCSYHSRSSHRPFFPALSDFAVDITAWLQRVTAEKFPRLPARTRRRRHASFELGGLRVARTLHNRPAIPTSLALIASAHAECTSARAPFRTTSARLLGLGRPRPWPTGLS